MKCSPTCRSCLEKLLRIAAEVSAVDDPLLAERALAAALEQLQQRFLSGNTVPTRLATSCLRSIRRITGVEDPFARTKHAEWEAAQRVLPLLGGGPCSDLFSLLQLSVLGNRLDFFRDIRQVEAEWRGRPPPLAVDESAEFAVVLSRTRRILFLTDNVGETLFDLPLLDHLSSRGIEVSVGVKGLASQNDLTRADVERLQIPLPGLVDTGTDVVGCDLERVGAPLRRAWEQADLVLAKGMANFETLTEYPHMLSEKQIFFLFCAKCQPVAAQWRVEVGESVFGSAERWAAGVGST